MFVGLLNKLKFDTVKPNGLKWSRHLFPQEYLKKWLLFYWNRDWNTRAVVFEYKIILIEQILHYTYISHEHLLANVYNLYRRSCSYIVNITKLYIHKISFCEELWYFIGIKITSTWLWIKFTKILLIISLQFLFKLNNCLFHVQYFLKTIGKR